jgi:DNA-binding XRE family transcriptional regulator
LTEIGKACKKWIVASRNMQSRPVRMALNAPPRPNHRLRELRRNKGWSAAYLGYQAGGVSAKTVRDIEEGRTRNPQARTMFLLAEALRTTVVDLESTSSSRSAA